MRCELFNIETGEQLAVYASVPSMLRIYGLGDVHCPEVGWTSPDGTVTLRALPTVVPTPDDVVLERNRRLSLGFSYDFQDGRGVHHIGTTPQDMKGWEEVTSASSAAMALGLGATPINIVTDTGPVSLTAQEWQQILLAAAAHRQPIWAASFALQAMSPIPADYADDSHWT